MKPIKTTVSTALKDTVSIVQQTPPLLHYEKPIKSYYIG